MKRSFLTSTARSVGITAVALGPFAVGAFPVPLFSLAGCTTVGVLLAFTLYAFTGAASSARIKNLALVILSVCFAGICLDLMSRTLLASVFYYGPDQRFSRRWPPMPLVNRYLPNVRYQGRAYGDLAAISGVKAYREYREVRFIVDRYGFKNEEAPRENPPHDLQVVILGDSFGAGTGTTQEKTWGSVLANMYGLRTYNLSAPGSLWHEYVNLALEIDRVMGHRRTVVVWSIFAGNDLDEPCHSILVPARLPWNNRFGALLASLETFKDRSPIGQLLSRVRFLREPNPVVATDFLDGKAVLFYSPYILRRDRAPYKVLQHPNYTCLRTTIRAMSRLRDAKHLLVAMVLVPSKEEVYSWLLDHDRPWSTSPAPSGFATALRSICEQEGIPFLDLKPFLLEASRQTFEGSGELLWWRDDTHWNPKGHEVVASIIYHNLLQPRLQMP